jgi:four helix bundle protein
MGQSYRDLVAWQKAMNFVMEVYRITKSFPRDEVYGFGKSAAKSGGCHSDQHR